MPALIEMTGTRWGKLLVIEFAFMDKWGSAHWFCSCQCSNTCIVNGKCLRRTVSPTRSCGCLRVAAIKKTRARFLERTRVSREVVKRAFRGTKFGRNGR
jgi:hypothetical protein